MNTYASHVIQILTNLNRANLSIVESFSLRKRVDNNISNHILVENPKVECRDHLRICYAA